MTCLGFAVGLDRDQGKVGIQAGCLAVPLTDRREEDWEIESRGLLLPCRHSPLSVNPK